MHLAWFSPMPPVRSGIATCSSELVAELRRDHEIDVFVDEPHARASSSGSNAPARSAHDFVWRNAQRPYDLTVYQLGNSSHHDYLWPYVFRFPGLAVLHDVHLHHARAAALLRERRAAHYRVEFAANEPEVSADAAELAVSGFDSHLLYDWPFIRLIVQTSRVTAMHSRVMVDRLKSEYPDAAIDHIHLGHGKLVPEDEMPRRRAAARTRLGISPEAVVFGCFGGLTPDKRIGQILDAFEALLPYSPTARLLLAGSPAAHYDVAGDVHGRGLSDSVLLTGYLESDDDLTDGIAACDVTLNLRWPSAREVSGPWLRCLAGGKPSITIDLTHTADVPSLDPRTWRANGADERSPVCVAIDILDEDHSLRLAMRRLATDAALRRALGDAARRYWISEHAQEIMFNDYRRLLGAAAQAAPPHALLPPHLRDDASGVMMDILDDVGVAVPWSKI